MDEIITQDLSRFGYRELHEAGRLLIACSDNQNNINDFLSNDIRVFFNSNSGYVFLSDSDFNVAMMNGDRIELWYSCPYCGHEGFFDDMEHEPEDQECTDYLVEIGVIEEEYEEEEDN